MSKSDDDYKIGYKKPPKYSRWKPGQSGNLGGRKRKKTNLPSLLEKELNKKVYITEDGQKKKIPKMEAVVRQMINKMAQGGDLKSFLKLAEFLLRWENLTKDTEAKDAGGLLVVTGTLSEEEWEAITEQETIKIIEEKS